MPAPPQPAPANRPAGRRVAVWLACAAAAALGSAALAHPGGLDAGGCHTNRKTGERHCHRGGSTPPTAAARPQRLLSGPALSYRNCDAARAAGAAPVYRGDPGYGPHLDRDNDGVGCEPYRGRR